MAKQNELVVTIRQQGRESRDVKDAGAYSILLQLARIFHQNGQDLVIEKGKSITAQATGFVTTEYIPNVYVNAPRGRGLKLHLVPGDCGCAFKHFGLGRPNG